MSNPPSAWVNSKIVVRQSFGWLAWLSKPFDTKGFGHFKQISLGIYELSNMKIV
jgi:hypothetical protein